MFEENKSVIILYCRRIYQSFSEHFRPVLDPVRIVSDCFRIWFGLQWAWHCGCPGTARVPTEFAESSLLGSRSPAPRQAPLPWEGCSIHAPRQSTSEYSCNAQEILLGGKSACWASGALCETLDSLGRSEKFFERPTNHLVTFGTPEIFSYIT